MAMQLVLYSDLDLAWMLAVAMALRHGARAAVWCGLGNREEKGEIMTSCRG